MLAALLARIATTELVPLAETLAERLAARGEAVAIATVERHLRDLVAAPDPAATFLAGAAHRLAALRDALDHHDAIALAPTPRSDRGPWGGEPAAPPTRDAAAPAGGDLGAAGAPAMAPTHAALARRLRAVPGVTVGAPRLERALLDERGRQSYAWIEDGAVHALGPARAAIAAALGEAAVAAPPWHATWATLTARGRNPWQVPPAAAADAGLAAALARTAAAAPRDPYRAVDPAAGFRAALAEWSRQAIAGLGELFAATAAGEVRPCADEQARAALASLANRPASLASAALVPLVLIEMAAGPLVEVVPTPPGLAFDVIGRAAGGCVRARAIRLLDPPQRLRAVALPRLPRGATVVEGGDTLITLFGP
jgi:hypothetical protein